MLNCEGYIKFNYELEDTDPLVAIDIEDLNEVRNILYSKKLIGVYKNGIGYGNISKRFGDGFIITGSSTGSKAELTAEDYAYVDNYNLNFNYVHCYGKVPASSEALTHAALYGYSSIIGAVLHVHSEDLWMNALHRLPTSKEDFTFGTRELAYDIQNMLQDHSIVERGIIVMGGHPEGIMLFGEDLPHAMRNLDKLYAL